LLYAAHILILLLNRMAMQTGEEEKGEVREGHRWLRFAAAR